MQSGNEIWELFFFLENHAQNLVEELFPDSSLKNKIEHISGSVVWSFIQFVLFYLKMLKLNFKSLI